MSKRDEQLSLARRAASLYYLDQKTQSEIAQELNCSRTKVVRLLKLAHDEKLIEIYIREEGPNEKNEQLKEELVAFFPELKKEYTRVSATFSIGEILLEKLGKMGGEVLGEIIDEVYSMIDSEMDSVKLGIGFGSQLRHVVNYSYPKTIRESLRVIPLIGGLRQDEDVLRFESNELARRLAKHYRGSWRHLLAPAKVHNTQVKATLEQEELISDLMSDARSADIYCVGIGGTKSEESAKIMAGLIKRAQLEELALSKNVVGTICAQLFTDAEFLFRIDLECQSHLDLKKISERLRQDFEKNGFSLSDDTTISTEVKNSRWLIKDSHQAFTARKEMNQINIYSVSKSISYPSGEIIGITLDDLKTGIKNGVYVLGVGGDTDKYKAILGALEGGYINCLVTDMRCADWIIQTKRKQLDSK